MSEISKRLAIVASFVDKGSFVADVGSDHAELLIYLFDHEVVEKAQGIENKQGPYARMCMAIKGAGYDDRCSLSLSDGVSQLAEGIDTVVVAGMGGRLIARILEEGKDKLGEVKTLVIDAHSERPFLSESIEKLGYRMVDNSFFYDEGIPYDVQKWEKSEEEVSYTPRERIFGPLNLVRKPAEWKYYWRKEEVRLSEMMSNDYLPEFKKAEYREQIADIKKAIA